ncbi:hypothetical protein TKK_0014599 [Trichogramma kaykai]
MEEKRLTSEHDQIGAFLSHSVKHRDYVPRHQNINNNGRHNQADSPKPKCYSCKKEGHYARVCRSRRRNNSTSSNNRQQGQKNKHSGENSNSAGTRFTGGFIASIDGSELPILEANSIYECKRGSDSSDVGDRWLTDNGATCHVTFHREWFEHMKTIDRVSVGIANDVCLEAIGIGRVNIKRRVNGEWLDGYLDDVLYVPQFRRNLFSTNVCTSKGLKVLFEGENVKVMTKSNEVVAEGRKFHRNICSLYFKVIVPREANISQSSCTLQSLHKTLGHINNDTTKKTVKSGAVKGIDKIIENDYFCEGCQYGKAHRGSHKTSTMENESFEPGECIHVDLCGYITQSLAEFCNREFRNF